MRPDTAPVQAVAARDTRGACAVLRRGPLASDGAAPPIPVARGDRRPRPDCFYSSRMRTLRNFTTPRPYCSAMGPSAYVESSMSTVCVPLSVTVSRVPSARIS